MRKVSIRIPSVDIKVTEDESNWFHFRAQNQINVSYLVFLDESGANFSMTKDYGRIEGGQRLVLAKPYARGHQHSMISAISQKEIVAGLYSEGSVDGELFIHFMESYLDPKNKKGDQVIVDNVSFHKVKGFE